MEILYLLRNKLLSMEVVCNHKQSSGRTVWENSTSAVWSFIFKSIIENHERYIKTLSFSPRSFEIDFILVGEKSNFIQ